MSKVLKFELSKRLNDLGLLDDIETEYIFTKRDIWFWNIDYDIIEWKYFKVNDWDIKTLTLEEAIEFLPSNFSLNNYWYHLQMGKKYIWYFKNVTYCLDSKNPIKEFSWDALLEAIEKMIEYLLDNNLLTK